MVPYDLRNNIEAELVVFFFADFRCNSVLLRTHVAVAKIFFFLEQAEIMDHCQAGGIIEDLENVKLKEEIDIKKRKWRKCEIKRGNLI
jgi:hypothetical protein